MRVLVAVTGGIAAYKACEVVRELQRRGVAVEVAMTAGAEEFVRPLTFAALTGRPVLKSLWEPGSDSKWEPTPEVPIEHIGVAQRIDAMVVCPATAHSLAKMAHGLSDDFVTAVYLATKAHVIVAPAMNVNMWEHPATIANMRLLRERGVHVVDPESGDLACGMVGSGRLAAPDAIADAVVRVLAGELDGSPTSSEVRGERGTRRGDGFDGDEFSAGDLAGETVLVTAGGTREPIDPVRFLGNRSSGKMGHALAEAALARGARVLLVTAAATTVAGCECVRVETAAEMMAAVLARVGRATVVIGAAAVSDFRVRAAAGQKLKRQGPMTLELEPTEDIIARVARARAPGTLVVAFAAETERVLEEARRKLVAKGVDAVVGNDVSRADRGFDADRNAGWFVTAEGVTELHEGTKREMAEAILNHVVTLRARTGAALAV